MSFLNPIFLFGLIALAVPIMLHLFYKTELKEMSFPYVRLLIAAQRETALRFKITDIVLLILRSLLIAFIILALARPIIIHFAGSALGLGTRTDTLVIIDNSAGMAYLEDGVPRWDRAIAAVNELITRMGPSDRLAVMPMYGLPPFGDYAVSRAQAKDILERLELFYGNTDGNINTAIGNFSDNPPDEIMIISDRNNTDILDELKAALPRGRLFFKRVFNGQTGNAAVNSVSGPALSIRGGMPVRLLFTVNNYSGDARKAFPVKLFIDGVIVAQQIIDIRPGASENVEFFLDPLEQGAYGGYVKIPDDNYPPDDTCYFGLKVKNPVDIILAGYAGSRDNPDEAWYIQQALSIQTPDMPYFNITTLSLPEITSLDPDPGSVFIIPGDIEINDEAARKLRDFYLGGGSVLAFGKPGLEIAGLNSGREMISVPSSGAEINLEPSSEIIWNDLAAGGFSPGGDMRVFKYYALPENGAVDYSVLISIEENPLMAEFKKRGRLVCWTGGIDPAWTNLQAHPFFLPLIHQTVHYLAHRADSPDISLTSSGTAAWQVSGPEPWKLRLDDGKFLTVPVKWEESTYHARVEDVPTPGLYALYKGNDTDEIQAMLASNPAGLESDFSHLPGAGKSDTAIFSTDSEELKQLTLDRTELTNLFLALAGFMALIELWYSNRYS